MKKLEFAKFNSMKIALVHDFLREYGGAERVLQALHQLFPQAPVYTAFVDQQALGIHWSLFKNWDIRESNFTQIPFYKKLYSPLRFLAARSFQAFDLSNYDLVISSSNAFMAKAVKVRKSVTQPAIGEKAAADQKIGADQKTTTGQKAAIHLCYCHTPPRALYGYSTMSAWKKNPLINFFGQLINHYMRIIDFEAAKNVDFFIANSQETQRRIKKFYRRDSVVIYPPVAIAGLNQQLSPSQSYYLFVGRLGLQKHPELAIKACNQLKLPLKVVGSGQLFTDLKKLAGPTIEFTGPVSDQELNNLYQQAQALIYPAEDEDFGIIPVEAMSYGVPVIAHYSGGPIETIIEGKTGLFFRQLKTASLIQALQNFTKQKFNRQLIKKHASQFNTESFNQKILNFINNLMIEKK